MKNFLKKAGFVIILTAAMISCKKTAGEGGNSSIYGTVWMEDWDATFAVLIGQYDATDYDVYIIYGDDVSYSDKTKTNYKGEYEFRYLRKGKYKIYMFSKDKTLIAASGEIAIIKEVSITAKKQKITLDKITVYK